jgi:hypothetical protein
MELPLEIRENTFDYVLSGVDEFRAPRDLPAIETLDSDKYEQLWRAWAKINLPREMFLSKQIVQEASLVAIRRSKIVLDLDDLDEDIEQLQLLHHYLGSFPDHQGYANVRHLKFDGDLLSDWAPIHELCVLCPGLREIDITLGYWTFQVKTMEEYQSCVDEMGLSRLFDVDQSWTLNITCFLTTQSPNSLARAQTFFQPFIQWFGEELRRRKSAIAIKFKYGSWQPDDFLI